MAARLLRDPEADGWERSDFPIVCETCLGPNPYVRMQRIEYGGECHISGRPYTVFRWRPGSDARYKKTIICQEVAKAKNVCQVCLLDLDYNLPVQVRDTALGNDEEPLPESDVNKEFQLQRMADEGTLDSSFAKAKANDTILRLQRTTPYYKRNQAPICSFYVKGECKRGAECPYRHEMPQTGELAEQNIKDRYYGVNDPVAKKMMRRVDEMPKLVPPEDTSITTLYVGGLTPDMGSEDLRDKFYAYGEIQSIKVLSARHCAFVTFTTRAAAEKAAEELNNRLIINGSRLKLMWGRPQEKRPEADPMQPYPAPAMLPPQVQMQMGGAAPFEPAGAKFFNLPPVGAAPAVAAYPSMDPMAMGTRARALVTSQSAPEVPLLEATIAGVHSALLSGQLTCSGLVQGYLQRITAYDKPTQLNAIRILNLNASNLALAKDVELQSLRESSKPLPPLFCVPLLVKDNIDTLGMSSTAGAIALLDNTPARDSNVVMRLQAAGAIVLAKTNMGEFAISPSESVGSVYGVVRNPYNLDHTTAGSSGGTAAGLAANLGLVGLGTDTGNSIRGPASHASVVGLRPTLGLNSRRGIVPARLNRDTCGPLARTVEDAARVFGLMIAVDPEDPLTNISSTVKLPADYTQFLDSSALSRARIGVFSQIANLLGTDPEVAALFNQALLDMSTAGATTVDFSIVGNSLGLDWDANRDGAGPAYGHWNINGSWENLWACDAAFRTDLDNYLLTAGSQVPYRTLQQIVQAGAYHPSIMSNMRSTLESRYRPADYPTPAMRAQGIRCGCLDYYLDPCRVEFRKRLIESMDALMVDVVVFPTWQKPPLLLGDVADDDGNNSPDIAPHTGTPALNVPMGFTKAGLPTGLQLLARPFDEAALFRVGYAYEQATLQRKVPGLFPELQNPLQTSSLPITSAGR
ncbi:hypothetical protein WJX72_010055 [[Myrmecia] bisecta]|uniref:Uncharacterized protein n=1 Tax=[Myrmecia] bisecta TaxID=41462 RepID=A0AAW1QGN4_9CHLO